MTKEKSITGALQELHEKTAHLMKQARDFAKEHEGAGVVVSHYHGAANAYEIMHGVIGEFLDGTRTDITGGEVEKPPMKKDNDAVSAFDFLMRELKSFIDESDVDNAYSLKINKWSKAAKAAIAPITGDTSDGYHTFNELYAHRHALFVALMKCHKDKSWRSLLHSDGTMFAGWFIAGIDTPDGQATYHMPMSVWETTEGIKTLRTAPEWDGHTPADVITRIGHLKTTGEDEKGVDLDDIKRDAHIYACTKVSHAQPVTCANVGHLMHPDDTDQICGRCGYQAPDRSGEVVIYGEKK